MEEIIQMFHGSDMEEINQMFPWKWGVRNYPETRTAGAAGPLVLEYGDFF